MNTPIVCASGVALLMDYLEGVLPESERAAIDAHVSGCLRCTAFVASYRATPEVLRRATEVAVPAELAASLLTFLRSHH